MPASNGGRLTGAELVRVLTRPRSVAIVGASGDAGSVSARPLAYMRRSGYTGRLVAVNPRLTAIDGVRCVARVEDLEPSEAEVALLAISASKVSPALAALSERGTRAAVSIASGFEESHDGPALRAGLKQVIGAAPTRLVGPNCVGVMSPGTGTHLNFSSVLQSKDVRPGRTALITQSGALGNGIVLSLIRRGAGLGLWVSTGDEVDVGALEILTGVLADDGIDAVGLFIEALTDLDWLDRCTEAVRSSAKPVVVLKAARTEAGRRAASGHTGRVVGAADVSRAVLRRLGATEVETVGQLADALVAADVLTRPGGRSVAVVSVSGGSGVLAADRIRTAGLELSPLHDAEARERIHSVLPRAHAQNPLDVPLLGETETFASAIVRLAEPGVADAVVAVESSLAHDREQLAQRLIEAAQAGPMVPVVLSHLSEDDVIDAELVAMLAQAGIAVAPTPERAVDMLDRLAPAAAPDEVTEADAHDAAPGLGFAETLAALGPGIPAPPTVEVASAEDARAQADALGYPVVLKAAGRAITHRTELGLVRTGIDADALDAVYRELAAAVAEHGDGVIVQKQAPAGIEMLVSVIADPEFGRVAIVRAGGILAELLDEQVALPALWSPEVRAQELRASRLGRLLSGHRGTRAHDLAALAQLVETLLTRLPQTSLESVEFNPVIVHRSGLSVVDAVATEAPGALSEATTNPEELTT